MKYISFAIPCYNSEAYMEKAIMIKAALADADAQ